MATIPAQTELAPDATTEESRAAAALTVAQHAIDADDLAMLLDMLGLRGEPLCIKCGEEMSHTDASGFRHSNGGDGVCWQCTPKVGRRTAVQCVAGHRRPDEGGACPSCEMYVPIEDARMLVERIKRDTGLSTYAIAKKVGVHAPSLASALVPSRKRRQIARTTYAALKRYAEELSA